MKSTKYQNHSLLDELFYELLSTSQLINPFLGKILKSMDSYEIISLKYLTYKLVTLLALCTGQRCQTLSVLELNNMNVFEDRVIFRLTTCTKC
jgi:hypothetical protein